MEIDELQWGDAETYIRDKNEPSVTTACPEDRWE